LQPMQRKHVFNSWGIDMRALYGRLQLGSRGVHNLHLQCGLLGACRRHVHSVCGRKVLDVNGISRMQRLCRRQVFNSRRGLNVINMPRLFARLQLSSRELNLHLQCGLLGA